MLGFLAGGKIKMAMYLGLALAVAGAIAYHYWTLNSVKNDLIEANQEIGVLRIDLATSQANEEKLTSAVEDQKHSITLLEDRRVIDQQKINVLNAQYTSARKSVGDLRKLLSRHDLAYLALRKPGLIEPRINKGTAGVGKRLEELTNE